MEKVLIAMSGGVDSAAAALYIKELGYECAGVTMKLCEKESSDIDDAKIICEKLGIEHHVLDLRDDFKKLVIDDFIREYKRGATPNPCVECNRTIKFGALLDFCLAHGFNKLATGHYAKIEQNIDGKYLLRQAKDRSKDQSYFLWSLTDDQLSRVIFPLGDSTKDEVRTIAEKNGFINAHKSDSQDICFISDGDYARFIEDYTKETFAKGNFIDTNGNILGKHTGIIHYTVGQRKGLGIALGKPAFVKEKDAEANTVTLCGDAELYKDELCASGANFSSACSFDAPLNLRAKIRYRHEAAEATLIKTSENSFKILFKEPQRAPAKGQSVVLYDGDIVVGGGIIE